jgi:hypothetical protein
VVGNEAGEGMKSECLTDAVSDLQHEKRSGDGRW